MNRKTKILFIINDATIGGGQIHLSQILNHIDRSRFIPCVMCSAKGDLVKTFQSESHLFYNITIQKCIKPRMLLALIGIIRNNHFNVIHTHGGIAGLWGRIGALIGRTHVIHTLHGIHFLKYSNMISRIFHIFIERILSKWTSETICVANSDLRQGLDHRLFKSDQCVVIHNGIDVESFIQKADFKFQKRELGINENSFVLLHVARLHPQKGQLYLLEAMVEIIKTIPHVQLLMVGDGPLKEKLYQTAFRLGVHTHIKFLGFQKDIPNLMSFADVFVLSSLWEGLPLSVLEAMAAGLPVVTTSVDGIREVLQDEKEGLLVPPKDPIALANAVIRIYKNKQLAQSLRSEAEEKVRKRFTTQVMVKRLEDLYTKYGEIL